MLYNVMRLSAQGLMNQAAAFGIEGLMDWRIQRFYSYFWLLNSDFLNKSSPQEAGNLKLLNFELETVYNRS